MQGTGKSVPLSTILKLFYHMHLKIKKTPDGEKGGSNGKEDKY